MFKRLYIIIFILVFLYIGRGICLGEGGLSWMDCVKEAAGNHPDLKITQDIYDIRRSNLELISLRYESGLEHRGALMTAQADLAVAQYNIKQAQRDLEVAQRQLTKEMGRTQFVPMRVSGTFQVRDAVRDKPDFEKLALNNPSLLQLIAQKNAAEYTLRSTYGNFFPTLNASAGGNKNGRRWPPKGDQWNLGLSLSLPIFEGGLRVAQVREAQAVLNQLASNQRSTRDSLVYTLEQTWAQLQDAIDNTAVQEQQLAAAQERSNISQAQYSIGFISFDNWTIIEDNLVIAMLALGQGAKEAIEKQLVSLGSNLLLIRPGSAKVHGISMEAGTVTRFTFADVAAIAKLSDEVKMLYPSVTGRGQLVYANNNWSTQVEGVGPEYAQMRAAEPVSGRFFTSQEVKMREKVAVVGMTVIRELFEDADPLGKTMKINLINFKVIGVLPEKGASSFHDQDDTVVIPVTTAMYRVFGKQYIDTIFVEAAGPEFLDSAQEAITKLIIKQHRLAKDEEDSFQVRNMADIKKTLEATTQTMAMLLGSIAAISLLVGGIGIMNIMLVSVTERTREIGLRKAIGANNKDILVQFLIEAVLMSFIGGLSGILLGGGAAWLITVFAHWTVSVSTFSMVLAAAFSLVVGVVFGLWPAKKAAQLDPIEALRYE